MIKFITYDEKKEYKQLIEQEIDKEMMNCDIEYKKTYFSSFSKELKQEINDEKFKIFILNQTNISKSGLEIAKYIREEQDDWKSIIIFISATEEYKINIVTKRLYILDYIILKEIESSLKELIKIAIKVYGSKPKELKYKYKNIDYNISYKDIIYIEKEQNNKRCIIHTKNDKYYIQTTLSKLISNLDDRFIKCSRSYIINLEQVLLYNTKDNIIIFKNKKEIYEISRDKKKEIVNKLRKV